MRLSDLLGIPRPGETGAGTLKGFLSIPQVAGLGWPEDVVDEWLWKLGSHLEFLDDYDSLELETVQWAREELPVTELVNLPTGPSEADLIEYNANHHQYLLQQRPVAIAHAWNSSGTWLAPPLLIDRILLGPSNTGLQIVEGRTRVGILRGRHRNGLFVAARHTVWVGR
ncbi:hypothetical protein ACIGO9_30245 [Nocardia asteroides]|uniref:hypothetical protein n=1 Tax=Nocardia asteroides TaxID=1824 RepID=UPI0037C8983C